MADLIGVKIAERCKELFHDLRCLGLIQVLILNNVVKQFASLTIPTSLNLTYGQQ